MEYPFESKNLTMGMPLCRNVSDPDIFFPEYRDPGANAIVREAKQVCEACPYKRVCLTWAVENDEIGIWGGTTERQRTILRKSRAKVKARSHPSEPTNFS